MLQTRPFRAQHLVAWNARMRQDNPAELVDKVVEAVLYQQGIPVEHSSEYRSVYTYEKLLEQLDHYGRTYIERMPKDGILAYGIREAFRIFSCPDANMRLDAVSLMSTAQVLFYELGIKGDRSAGLTAYGENKFEAFTTALDKVQAILCDGKAPAPCLAGTRTQRKGKTRLVWMYPLEMTIIEAVVARPLINYFKGITHVMSFGDYSHETGLRLRRSCSSNKYFYALDYSQFDSTVSTIFINAAFDAFETWFNLEGKIMGDITVGDIFKRIRSYFVTTPIVMPSEGKFPLLYIGKRGGVPSGSYFTQLVDSFTNVVLAKMISSRFSLNLKDDDINVLGDDCTFFSNDPRGERLLDEIKSFVQRYEFRVNLEKSTFGSTAEDVEYLGRHWRNGYPIRTRHELMRSVLYPERSRRYSKNRAERQQQALNVVSSFLLTSYCDDPNCDLTRFNHLYHLSPDMSSGFSAFLMKEGMIPGTVLERAIF